MQTKRISLQPPTVTVLAHSPLLHVLIKCLAFMHFRYKSSSTCIFFHSEMFFCKISDKDTFRYLQILYHQPNFQFVGAT